MQSASSQEIHFAVAQNGNQPHWAVGALCGMRPYRGSWCTCDFLLPICVPLVIPAQEKDRERKGCELSTCRWRRS